MIPTELSRITQLDVAGSMDHFRRPHGDQLCRPLTRVGELLLATPREVSNARFEPSIDDAAPIEGPANQRNPE